MEQPKPTRGGKRPNSGRKKGEATVTLSYRVKAATSKELDGKIKEVIKLHYENSTEV